MKLDLTTGNPLKKILFFMLPLLIGNVFQQLYNIADTIIVGQTLGVDALAAVGATGAINFVIFGFASGITGGITVITAQYAGAKDYKQVSRSIAVSFIICSVLVVLLTVLGMIYTKDLLLLLNVPDDIIDQSLAYQKVIFAGVIGTIFYNFTSSVLRALGDSKTPLMFLIVASIISVGLDYFFILVLGTGVEGAAFATVIAQFLSGLACFLYAMKKYPYLRLKKEDFNMNYRWVMKHLNIGLPIALQNSITGLGIMVFQSALNDFGSNTVAAFTACSKIESIAIMPMFSISTALSTYVAQNYGAGKVKRIKQGVNASIILNLTLSIIGSIIVINLYEPLIQIFVGKQQAEVVETARIYLQIVGWFYFSLAFLFVYRGALQGLGNALIPLIGGIIELFMRVTAAVFLADILGFTGLSMAYPMAWFSAAVLSIVAYFIKYRKNFGLKYEELE